MSDARPSVQMSAEEAAGTAAEAEPDMGPAAEQNITRKKPSEAVVKLVTKNLLEKRNR